MNFETLRRIGELEHKLTELAQKLDKLSLDLTEFARDTQARIKQLEERRILRLPKKNA